jgi:23S rRNA (cytidine2498-2'-O)-methyltransferase
MPEDSPSRAWLKLEEAVNFWALDFMPGEIAVELGCSPGGVVHALLNYGVSVIGVDPAGMADVVTARGVEQRERLGFGAPGFYHCRKPAALVSKRELGEGVSWFFSDMNQNPEVTLKECARIVKMAPSIRGVLITLKLSEMEAVERKAEWIQSLGDLGFNTVRLQQLAVHHRELALLGLR